MTPFPIDKQFDARSSTPIYRQLADSIRSAIGAGKLAPGDRLPPTRELAGLLGLNRATVSASYTVLEQEGLITGHVGKGSFVATRPDQPIAPTVGVNWRNVLPTVTPQASQRPTGISFANSRPSEDLFPVQEIREAANEVLGSPEATQILQLGTPHGYAPLRRYLLDQARDRGYAGPGDDIVITSGCQQAMDLLQRVLLPQGSSESVLLEDPVYPGLRNVFARAGARILTVPVGIDGLDFARLEAVLLRERPRLAVLTPSFQNPTGSTIPGDRRRAIVMAAREAGTVLVENDIYANLRYEGAPLAPLKAHDDRGDSVLVGSFSKMAFPGLRVGWVIGPAPLLARVAEAKQWCDLHTDQLSQSILLRFALSGRMERHHQIILEAGSARLAAVLSACERYLPPGSAYSRPEGGMNIWIQLPEPLDAGQLAPKAAELGVSFLPGEFFSNGSPQRSSLRLSFAGVDPGRIDSGVRLLGELFTRELAQTHWRGLTEPAPALV